MAMFITICMRCLNNISAYDIPTKKEKELSHGLCRRCTLITLEEHGIIKPEELAELREMERAQI